MANESRAGRARPSGEQPRHDSAGNLIRNAILLGLPDGERDAVFASAGFVDLPIRFVLNEIGEPIQYAYFINEGLVSIVNVMGDGKSVEVGIVGKEGFVGVPLVAGFRTSPARAVTQVAGNAFQIGEHDLVVALRRCPVLERSLQRFSQQLGLQAIQVAACNRLHPVEARMARWLLMSQDRLGGDLVPLTHEFLSHMLGTRRASVTEAASALQKARLITYERGKVTVKNRAGLERAACECYPALVRQSHNWEAESA